MVSGSNPPSSTTSKPASRVSETRSIPAVISSLRSSFRDAEYDDAERELLSREESLRREKDRLRREKEEVELSRDLLEADLSGLRLEVVKLEQDLAKLRRECEFSDDKLTELATDLSVAREKEAEANKRYGKMCEKVRVLEEEKEKFLDELQRDQSSYAEKLTTLSDVVADLRGELREKDAEIDELREVRVRNEGLEERIEELEMRKELDRKEVDARLEEMRRIDREKEERIKELERKIETLDMEKGEMLKQNEGLRAEKRQEQVKILEMEKQVSKLESCVEKKIETLETEKMDLLKQNEGLRAEKRQGEVKMEEIEKQVSMLESCVATWVFNAPKDQQLGDVEVQKILSAIVKALDSEGVGVARAIASTGTRAERVPVSNIIEIESGSDDDDNDEFRLSELKKRSLNKRVEGEGSSEDSLNPRNKMKKLNDLAQEKFKHDSTASAPSTIRKCNEKPREGSSREGNQICSPQVKELLVSCRRRRAN